MTAIPAPSILPAEPSTNRDEHGSRRPAARPRSQPRVEVIDSEHALIAAGEAWEDLWCNSTTALPLVRPEFIGSWCARYAPGGRMRVLTVVDDGRMLAALPLVGSSFRGSPEIGVLTNNSWSETGDLLLRRDADMTAVIKSLATAIREDLPWPLVFLRYVQHEQPRWRALVKALSQSGTALSVRHTQDVAVAELEGDFAGYQQNFSRNFRRNLRRRRAKIDKAGGFELEIVEDFDEADLETMLRAGFEIERQCWKGREGSSVLQTPGMFHYYLREAHALAERGELSLIYLVHGGRRIAFQYAYRSEGHYFLPKLGYDEEFAHYSPGHLLTEAMMQRFCEAESSVRVDFHGELGPASEPWMTESYPIATIVLSNRSWIGRPLVGAYRLARLGRRSIRNVFQCD